VSALSKEPETQSSPQRSQTEYPLFKPIAATQVERAAVPSCFLTLFLVLCTILAENAVSWTGDNSLRKGRDGCFPGYLTPVNSDLNPTPKEQWGYFDIFIFCIY